MFDYLKLNIKVIFIAKKFCVGMVKRFFNIGFISFYIYKYFSVSLSSADFSLVLLFLVLIYCHHVFQQML